MYGDDKFRRLSAPQPNAQTLWVYLLTGPHTTCIPGLFQAGPASLAESLGWPLKALNRFLQEILDQHMMKVDRATRLVWIPKACEHNVPENPNVVKHWRATWHDLPECTLKDEVEAALKAFTKGLGESFAKAFGEVLGKPLSNSEQEQEKESEQEQEQERGARKKEDLWQAPRTNKLVPLPDGFEISQTIREWVKENHIPKVNAEFEKFCDHHLAKGSQFVNWDAALKKWLRNSVEFAKPQPGVVGFIDDQN